MSFSYTFCKVYFSFPIAYDREALAVTKDVFHVWRVYFLGYKRFSMVSDHTTLTRLLKQSSDELSDRKVHGVE